MSRSVQTTYYTQPRHMPPNGYNSYQHDDADPATYVRYVAYLHWYRPTFTTQLAFGKVESIFNISDSLSPITRECQHQKIVALGLRNTSFSVIPVDNLHWSIMHWSIIYVDHVAHTTGYLNFLPSVLSAFIASLRSLAPSTTSFARRLPTYSKILRSWSGVGGSSVMFSSNSDRWILFCLLWSPAWSTVAVSLAVAEACFNIARARIEDGVPGLWNSVITSREFRCDLISWHRQGHHGAPYPAEHIQ